MDENLRRELAKGIDEAHRHRFVEGARCAICGAEDVKVALHVIKFAAGKGEAVPDGAIPQSESFGTVRGGFPICERCAPPCPKCNLPVVKKPVKEYFESVHNKWHSSNSPINWSNGKCSHFWLFGKWPL